MIPFQEQITNKFGNDSMVFVFNVLPETFHIINQNTLVGVGNFLGILFFIVLLFAGLSSLIAMLELAVDAIETQYDISKQKVICGICATIIIVGLSLTFANTY
ncbi:hypothetical protein [Spiroplasma endosymbiont of Glossina fuscipes fuscipes]|uniref:hypothetical protein n=2 Tax=Spiroplasma endosymbiont of Glossina fuscipes fuscipes TaxID=2004463 RepID=UPI003C71FCCA